VTLLETLDQAAERRAVLKAGTLDRPWTTVQRAVLDTPYAITVFWGSNAAGKTMAMAEYARRYLGRQLPWQVVERTPPELLVVSRTWGQVSQLVEYLWAAVDRRWFSGALHFDAGALRGQRLPIFDLVAGPGKGGKLRLGVFDAPNLAGPRAGLVISDEPVPQKVYTELITRTWGRGDRTRMLIGYTPTISNAHDLDYLWEAVDDPARPWVGQVQAPLTVETTTPRGGLVELPWMSARRIREEEANIPALERELRMGRARHPAGGAPFFDRWSAEAMVVRRDLEQLRREGWRLAVGVDHGSRPGAQCACLVAIFPMGPGRCRVHVVAEYVTTSTSSEDDGAGIVGMLRRAALPVEAVDLWVGDRAHESNKRAVFKSNDRLKAGIARALNIDVSGRNWSGKLPRALRFMQTPKKYARSHHERSAVLHELMRSDLFSVDPSCAEVRRAIETWEGGSKEPAKDKLDAMGYPVTEGPWMAPVRGAA
jgi:hypothetical protein